MDIIFLHEIKIDLIIGLYEWERKTPQTVRLDIDIGLRDSSAGKSDQVTDTIDYADVIAHIEASLVGKKFSLVEALAEFIANLILSDFKTPWVKVAVMKLGLLKNVKYLGVVIERKAVANRLSNSLSTRVPGQPRG